MLGKRSLKKEVSRQQRTRKAINLKDAREIGILFSMHSEADFDRITRFTNELRADGKKVRVIGSYKYRKLPPYYAPKLSYDLILPHNLDVFYRPRAEFVSKFIDYKFDMLINLGTSDDFPLQYIATLSKAGFKLGHSFGDETVPYDVTIETEDEIQSEELIRQIVHYTSAFKFK